jgi:hypothetical protein
MLTIQRIHLTQAAAADIITREQADRLWSFLSEHVAAASSAAPLAEPGPRFTFTNVLYYLGGLLAIGAMSLFMTLGWESFGGWGIFFIALLYMGCALVLANRFERQGHAVPMGIMAALVVVLVPLATYGLQQALGWWADTATIRGYRAYHTLIDWRWVTLEFATLVAGVLMVYRYRAPFLLMPVAVTLWYMSMDVAIMLMGPDARPWGLSEWEFRKWFALAFGLILVLIAFWVDLRSRFTRDYAFWLYLFGLLAFWGALTSMGSNALAGKLAYLAINLGLVFIGAVLVRRAFTVFGALGVAIVLADISWRFFRDSWLFPIALTLIGLAIIYVGLWWNRHSDPLARRFQSWLPPDLRELIAVRRQIPHG